MRRHYLIQSTEHPSADKNRRKLQLPFVSGTDHRKLLHNIVLLFFLKLKHARVHSVTVQQPLHHVTHTTSVTSQYDNGVFRHGVSHRTFCRSGESRRRFQIAGVVVHRQSPCLVRNCLLHFSNLLSVCVFVCVIWCFGVRNL
ncbi:hypothetical protein L1987_84011 [Smallanthus sonchifolius]|uniref:Uncharacterized protein n=1 Tax=Smallanthus sonchifolius TaxID=185202 RepID=A0ACB8YDJ3_9ASTR|nr:hypothetical protein L1987_84011 [Smallanthus sonchifolius]